MRILVTAFDPFGGEKVNAAGMALERVPERAGDMEIIKLTVPTEFDRCVECAAREYERARPDAVLCLGQASGRGEITPERVAINLDDARMPDNAGKMPVDEPIDARGPEAYFSTLPIKAMAEAIRGNNIPAGISNTAGTFVCNHLMYGMLRFISGRGENVPCGFMHVPAAPDAEMPERASMDTEKTAAGVLAAIETIGAYLRDKMN